MLGVVLGVMCVGCCEGVAVRSPDVNAFTRPATAPAPATPEATWSPCRWRKLLNVEAAADASDIETEDGSLYPDEAVCRAARFWAQLVPPVAAGVLEVGAGWVGVPDVWNVEPTLKPGTEMPLDERLDSADWLI